MKIWTKVHIKQLDKNMQTITKSFSNYLFWKGPIEEIGKKYNMTSDDKEALKKYTANRIAGLLLLYFAEDQKRIKDIVNKYNIVTELEINPEIEGYIQK